MLIFSDIGIVLEMIGFIILLWDIRKSKGSITEENIPIATADGNILTTEDGIPIVTEQTETVKSHDYQPGNKPHLYRYKIIAIGMVVGGLVLQISYVNEFLFQLMTCLIQ